MRLVEGGTKLCALSKVAVGGTCTFSHVSHVQAVEGSVTHRQSWIAALYAGQQQGTIKKSMHLPLHAIRVQLQHAENALHATVGTALCSCMHEGLHLAAYFLPSPNCVPAGMKRYVRFSALFQARWCAFAHQVLAVNFPAGPCVSFSAG